MLPQLSRTKIQFNEGFNIPIYCHNKIKWREGTMSDKVIDIHKHSKLQWKEAVGHLIMHPVK